VSAEDSYGTGAISSEVWEVMLASAEKTGLIVNLMEHSITIDKNAVMSSKRVDHILS
jgi:hypothetical protein